MKLSTIAAILASSLNLPHSALLVNQIPSKSRGHGEGKGEGLSHNKYARSSFKQNKRRGL